jgi:hypothetical protein
MRAKKVNEAIKWLTPRSKEEVDAFILKMPAGREKSILAKKWGLNYQKDHQKQKNKFYEKFQDTI